MAILIKNKRDLYSSTAHLSSASVSDTHAARNIISVMLRHYPHHVSVRLWNRELAFGDARSKCCIIIHEPSVLSDIFLKRDLMHLMEHYIARRFSVEGRLEDVFQLGEWVSHQGFTLQEKWFVTKNALKMSTFKNTLMTGNNAGSPVKTAANSVSNRHQSVGNAFYRLWLDPEMEYSSAYFEDENQTLETAQQNKLDYICRKLRLIPGQHILDIGCGWGALACWAARHYGVTVDGITTNRQQYQYALAKVHSEGLAIRVNIRFIGYRDLPLHSTYDRVVSVSMFENTDHCRSPLYFNSVNRLLKPGGLILSHGINSFDGWQRTQIREFVHQYINPDGELTRMSNVCASLESSGFEIHDVESMHRHYSLTLKHWLSRLRAHREHAVIVSSESTYRLWELYLAGCIYFFSRGEIGVNQILASRRKEAHKLPLTRADLYCEAANDPHYNLQ